MKIIKLSVVTCSFLFTGCSVDSFLLSAHPEKPVIIINHPPNRIGYWGALSDADMKNIQDIYSIMKDEKYIDHKYKFQLGAEINHDVDIQQGRSFKGASSLTTKRRKR